MDICDDINPFIYLYHAKVIPFNWPLLSSNPAGLVNVTTVILYSGGHLRRNAETDLRA